MSLLLSTISILFIIIISKISEDFQFDLLTNADDVKKITVEDKLNALEVMVMTTLMMISMGIFPKWAGRGRQRQFETFQKIHTQPTEARGGRPSPGGGVKVIQIIQFHSHHRHCQHQHHCPHNNHHHHQESERGLLCSQSFKKLRRKGLAVDLATIMVTIMMVTIMVMIIIVTIIVATIMVTMMVTIMVDLASLIMALMTNQYQYQAAHAITIF